MIWAVWFGGNGFSLCEYSETGCEQHLELTDTALKKQERSAVAVNENETAAE